MELEAPVLDSKRPRLAPTFQPSVCNGDLPGPRCGHTLTAVAAVGEPDSPNYVGARLILFGGATALEPSGGPSSGGAAGIRLAGATADVHSFDVATCTWTKLSPSGDPPSPRAAHAATAVGTMVVIQGGIGPAGLATDDLHVLDLTPPKPKWHRVVVQGAGPGPRYGHVMALVGQRFLLSISGNDGKRPLADVWQLDTAAKPYEWKKLEPEGDGPPPCMYSTASARSDGLLLLCGGRDSNSVPLSGAYGLARHRDGRWEWAVAPGTSPSPRYQHAAVFVNTRLHVSGGALGGGRMVEDSSSVAVLDTTAGLWCDRKGVVNSPRIGRFSADAPGGEASIELTRRCRHAAASVGETIFIYGGLRGGILLDDLLKAEDSPKDTIPLSPSSSVTPSPPSSDTSSTSISSTPSTSPSISPSSSPPSSPLALKNETSPLKEEKKAVPDELLVAPPVLPTSPSFTEADTMDRSEENDAENEDGSVEDDRRLDEHTKEAMVAKEVLEKVRLKDMNDETIPSVESMNNNENNMHVENGTSRTSIWEQTNEENDVRLAPKAVLAPMDGFGRLVRMYSLDKLESEGRRVSCGTPGSGEAASRLIARIPTTQGVHKKVITQLLKPRDWRPPTRRQFFLDAQEISELCDLVEKQFEQEPSVLKLRAPVKIFGDLHGQFGDLMRLFDEYGSPSTAGDITYIDYLFLGDYVDRGQHSLETIALLFALKIENPSNVHLIRGNHEAADINSLFGFRNECIDRMGEAPGIWAWQRINHVFNWLPLAALIERKILCMHGGIGRSIRHIHQIESLQRPITMETGSTVLMDLLWSDPTENDSVEGLRPNARGPGLVTFGPDRVLEFCRINDIQLIVRAHECVMDGFERFAQGHLITLFSATNYCGTANNAGAILVLGRNLVVVPKLIHPLPPQPHSPDSNQHDDVWMQELNAQRPPTPTRGRPQPGSDRNSLAFI